MASPKKKPVFIHNEAKNTITISFDEECAHCGGTGIYVGMAEQDGAGVVCSYCNGTGCVPSKLEYKLFTERKKRKNVTRVYKTSGGYGISAVDVTANKRTVHFSQAGVSYKDWLNGEQPIPIRELHCPLEHYEQGTTKGKLLKKEHCRQHLKFGDSISECSAKHREECWVSYQKSIKKK